VLVRPLTTSAARSGSPAATASMMVPMFTGRRSVQG
jgi:hypothetical protein